MGDKIATVAERCTKVIKLQRLKEVRKQLMGGMATVTIIQDLSEKWGLAERTIQKYITHINHEMDAAGRMQTIGARTAQRRGQLENLYETCILNKDYKTAALVMDRLCKIDGAYQPSATIHDVRHRVVGYSPEERAQRIVDLQKMRVEYIDAEFDDNKNKELPENIEETDDL